MTQAWMTTTLNRGEVIARLLRVPASVLEKD